MRRQVLGLLLQAQVIAGVGCSARTVVPADDGTRSGALCDHGINVDAPLSADPGRQGAMWLAFEYVPSESIAASRIELHTNSGGVAILADDDGRPGDAILYQPFGDDGSSPDVGRWLGIDLRPAFRFEAGRRYWIAKRVGDCVVCNMLSAADETRGGKRVRMFSSALALSGPWEGPYDDAEKIRVLSECSD